MGGSGSAGPSAAAGAGPSGAALRGRPPSGYLQFAAAERAGAAAGLREEGRPAGEVAKVLGARWRALGEVEKAEWGARAMAAARAKAAAGEAPKAKGGSAGPRSRGISSFMVFANEHRAALKAELQAAGATDVGVSVIGKALGERWRALSEEEKAQYKAKAAELVPAVDPVGVGEADAAAAAAERPPLPLATVKKLVCSDPDVKRISAEGLKAVTFATALYLESLAGEALDAAQRSGRRTLRFEDLQRAAQNKSRNFFLADPLRYVRAVFMGSAGGSAGGDGMAGPSIRDALGNAAAAAAKRPPKAPGTEGAGVGDGGDDAPAGDPAEASLPLANLAKGNGRACRRDKFLEAPAGTKQMTHFFTKKSMDSTLEAGGCGRPGHAEAENGARKRVSPDVASPQGASKPRKRVRILDSDDESEEDQEEQPEAEAGGAAQEVAVQPPPLEA